VAPGWNYPSSALIELIEVCRTLQAELLLKGLVDDARSYAGRELSLALSMLLVLGPEQQHLFGGSSEGGRVYPKWVRVLDLPQSKHGMALIEVIAMRIPHELRDEFPQEISLIERMVRTNYELRRLAARYDEVNRNIHRIESKEEPTTDEVLERLKKLRLKLKDEIAAILTKLEHRM